MVLFRRFLRAVCCLTAVGAIQVQSGFAEDQSDHFKDKVAPFLKKYCSDCHASGTGEAGVAFDTMASHAEATKSGQLWVRVLDVLDSRTMPPVDADQPTIDESEAVIEWIENDFVRTISQNDTPLPATVIRRLNRIEYNNTIRDLLHVNLDLAKEFPADEIGYGFDNIGSVLSLSPVHLEKLLTAAEQATAAAVWTPSAEGFAPIELIGLRTYPLAETGPTEFEHTLAPGTYLTEFSLVRVGISETVPPPVVEVSFGTDKRAVKAVRVHDETVVYRFWLNVADKDAKVSVSIVKEDGPKPTDLVTNSESGDQRYGNSFGHHVDSMVVRGPVNRATIGDFPGHSKILFASPSEQNDTARATAAQEIVSSFARRAFRRPPTQAEVDRLMKIYSLATERGESFEHAIQFVLTSALVSPQFLYLLEDDESSNGQLSPPELANRLSYFLWSSMPDEELMRLADNGQLSSQLHEQVTRMLKDPKVDSFIQAFCGQWLQIRRLDEVSPDQELFPSFSPALRAAMRKESELYFGYILKNNRSALELIDSNYTFVNKDLATHYGLSDFSGDDFQKYEINNGQRGGVMTHASVLTVTSNPNRTSPVKRGKWVLQQILGTPPPPPPPIVESLDESAAASEEATLRERFLKHRENPACASCHAQMDPIGFSLENYDAIGRWRTNDGQFPVDASGELPGGTTFEDGLEFKKQLTVMGRKRFGRSMVKNLLTYSLGRGLELQDIGTVEEVRKKWEADDYRLQSIVFGIVDSKVFQSRGGSALTSQ